MKRLLSATTVVVASALLLAGCGGGGSPMDPPPDTMEPMEPMEPEKPDTSALGGGLAKAIGMGELDAADTNRVGVDTDSGTTGTQEPTLASVANGRMFVPTDFEASSDGPANIAGWQGAMHIRVSGDDDEITDTIVVYTDEEDATAEDYTEYFSTTDAGNRDAVTSADANGVLTIDGAGLAGHHARFNANFGITGPYQTIPAPVDDTATDGVDESQVRIAGTFYGVPGEFACDSECSRTSDEDGNLSGLGGSWTFTPTGDVEDIMVAGVIRDVDYLTFGYWLQATEGDEETAYAASNFAGGARDYDSTADVEGTAEYTGAATGLYTKRAFAEDGTSEAVAGGQFTAHASLSASFGGGDVPANDQDTVTGMIDDFRDSDGDEIDSKWVVELMKSTASTTGSFRGETTGGGIYAGLFHGADPDNENVHPTAASGTFDAHFSNGDVLGAFGVNLDE